MKLELTKIELREFWIRDITDEQWSVAGKIRFEFTAGERFSDVTVGCGVRVSKDIGLRDARAKVIEAALELVAEVHQLSADQVEQSARKWDQWRPESHEESLIAKP